MIITFGKNKIKNIKEFAQFAQLHHAKDFMCECEFCEYRGIRVKSGANLIGYTFTNEGYMGVFQCPKCFDIYRHHIRSINRNNIEDFKIYCAKILETES